MANERFRSALATARVDVQTVAERLEVDPKTVQRWLMGRTPHRRHRWALVALVGEDEDYLWPKVRGEDAEAGERETHAEIVTAYTHRASAPDTLWRGLLERSCRHIDAMGYAMLFLPEQHPDLAQLIEQKAAAGCKIRLSVADPPASRRVSATSWKT